jgi:O-antigen/teichoic acid export membrane protein
MSKSYVFFITAVILILGVVNKAHAYIDLGTGSYIVQAIIAAIVTSLFLLRNYFLKLKKWVGKFFKKNYDED